MCVLGNYFSSIRQGMRPGHNHPSSTYASWSRLTKSCFDGNNEYPTFSWLGHVKYAPGVCATVRPLRAEVPVHPLCWFLSKSKYALGMRWSSCSNWNTVRIPPRCIHWNPKGKGYAPGMRQAPLYSNIRTTLSSMDLVFAAGRQVCDDCFPESAAVPQVCGLNLDMARRLLY